MRRKLRGALIDIEIVGDCGVPKTIVETAVERKKKARLEARRMKDENRDYDEVWAVFDVDQHPNLADAKQQAAAHNIELAISNPAVEIWILLHYQDQRAAQDHHWMQRRCAVYIPGYDKHIPFEELWGIHATALDKAHRLDRWQDEQGRPGGNPSTGIYRLVERLKEKAKSESEAIANRC